MAIWNGSLFSGHLHKGNLDLVFEEPFKILLVMADQAVLHFVDEIEFENKGNGISGAIILSGKYLLPLL